MKKDVSLTPLANYLEYANPRQWIGAILIALLASACQKTAPPSPAANPAHERLAKAEAMFADRCKKSGEFIHRTVEDVEGVLLLSRLP